MRFGEREFLKENCRSKKVIEVTSKMIKYHVDMVSKIIKENDLILIHGGGFLGDL